MTLSNDFKYVAKVTKSGNWQRYRTARLGISVDQPYHESDKFRATIDWVSARFDHIQILVADTLQRYNMPGGDIPDNRAVARRAGDQWLKRNMVTLQRLKSFEIIRWDDLLNDQNFNVYTSFTKKNLDIKNPYVAEEVAAVLMLQDRKPASEIYPGSFLPIWKELDRPDLSHTSISFLKKPAKQSLSA